MKSFFTYVLLVGIPTAGVFGILRAGRALHAPRAIGGEWRVTAGPLAGSTFEVQQSGEHLAIVLPGGTRLRGKSRGDTLELAHAGQAITHSAVCGPELGTTFRAVLDFSATPARMNGASAVSREGCPALPIRAERLPRAARTGGGH